MLLGPEMIVYVGSIFYVGFRFLPTLEGPITPWFNMIRRHRLKLWWDNLHRLKELTEVDKIHKFSSDK